MIVLASIDSGLGDALAQIAAALRVPVMILSLVALLAATVELGRFATEVFRRARRSGARELRWMALQAVTDPDSADRRAGNAPTAFAERAVREIAKSTRAHDPAVAEQALADYELAAERRLDRTRLLVRVGPALGLMGTLIPLAPGLEALGGGDVASLADDLRTAFGATVIGLLVGTVAFALTLTRTRMYTEDLTTLERAVERTKP